jgi:hypothetical protein
MDGEQVQVTITSVSARTMRVVFRVSTYTVRHAMIVQVRDHQAPHDDIAQAMLEGAMQRYQSYAL